MWARDERGFKFTPSEGIGNSVFSDWGFGQYPIEQLSGINSSETAAESIGSSTLRFR
ncbi:hypothetical protein H5410_033875 [Solanum commersonii]|uniref:Uncharacterized protein n=1 Tax=Solanum commersonii TaxID=4109 RepID=A0A9J5YPV4_SOLCO|nr:hypothetical protein H5410_033875 [Solanum commersonii]